MGLKDKRWAKLTEQLRHHPVVLAYLVLMLFLFVNATVNASSVWVDLQRTAATNFSRWEPFLWEYSSAVSTLLWSTLLFWWFRCNPLRLTQVTRQIISHLFASLVFSLLHITTMILLRQVWYTLAGTQYSFEPLTSDFFYEYRKDVWAYVFLLSCYQIARFVHSRLRGEAHEIDEAENKSNVATPNGSEHAPKYFLIKKLDKEFLLATADIEWLEANGNYVNLHSKGRIYPLRATLSATLQQLQSLGFCRVHRSLAVNINQVVSVQYQNSGDGEVSLQSSQKLTISRRYKSEFKRYWQAG